MWWGDWFFLALMATLANGLQGFLFKSSVAKHQDIYLVTFYAATVSYVIAGGALLFRGAGVGGWKELLLFGLAGGVGFMIVMLTRLAALRYLSTAAVLTTGAIVAPALMHLGIPRIQTGSIIAMAALYGMIAPPINVPVMIIGGGVICLTSDLSYHCFLRHFLWQFLRQQPLAIVM